VVDPQVVELAPRVRRIPDLGDAKRRLRAC